MDGVDAYRNVSNKLPQQGKVTLYANPMFEASDDMIDIKPGSFLNIKVCRRHRSKRNGFTNICVKFLYNYISNCVNLKTICDNDVFGKLFAITTLKSR